MLKAAIIMGSDSDLPVMKEAALALDGFGVGYEVKFLSAHRTHEETREYIASAPGKGVGVIIAGAGGAAHLPGVIAALTNIPVIGVPVKAWSLEGLDSLLSIAQMPPGIPVATVGINSAKNAGILAAQILAVGDSALAGKLASARAKMRDDIMAKNARLEKEGWAAYLEKNKK
ncbi:MAG: 5-(carboxyamino)imidazole ribonucleotide mutase [Elusimicrobiales bacterium]|jgi:phosphoribosylaminoimidazole carboxylase PurE protein|nr:5-(carboxyamino)imidazole ribonucleotide mutase [Elusimicrobiales bacterium]